MSGEQVAVRCADCGAPMVERVNRVNDSHFLGCSNFPACTHTEKVPAYVEMKRAGGIELPGMGE